MQLPAKQSATAGFVSLLYMDSTVVPLRVGAEVQLPVQQQSAWHQGLMGGQPRTGEWGPEDC